MTMRITGMNSGLDTESIITELIKAKSAKKDTYTKEQKKLEYKQEAWNTLNSKIYTLYSKTLSELSYTSTYKKKTTKASKSSVADVITGKEASNGVQELKVDKLAKAGYLTGAQLKKGGAIADYSASTKLNELVPSVGDATFSITTGGKTTEINVNGESTINDVVTQLRKAGVNANFDEKNQRLFISAQTTGEKADFELKAESAAGVANNAGRQILTALGVTTEAGATRVEGTDAKIYLNKAEFTSNTNTFEINGLTITALSETAENEVVTLTTSDDYEEIYDTIKNFFKEYNTLINEMDKLYNAESAKGYDPLLDEEKEALTESEVEKWETKIKDSILRRDSTLGEITNILKTTMMQGFKVNGETMYLSSFGINTLGYFVSGDNEKGAYHIDGDPDDENTRGNADVLKSMIASDPETVVSFFTQLTHEMYTKLGKKMQSSDYSSFNKVYNDKQMKSELESYEEKIERQQEIITAAEDKYYKQFSAMETALAKLQSKENAIAGLLGG